MKKFIVLLYVLLAAFCFTQEIEWKVIKNTELYDGNYNYIKDIQNSMIVTARDTGITIPSKKMKAAYDARIFFNNEKFAIDAEAVIPNGTQDLLDENLLTPAVYRRGKTWFNAHSIPILQSKNRETARQFERETLQSIDRQSEGYWYDSAYMGETMDLFQVVINMRGIQTRGTFYITDIQKRNTHYALMTLCDYFHNPIPLDRQPEQGKESILLLYPDGEYIDIYIENTDNYLWSFVQVDEEYQKQFWTLIRQAWYPDNVFNLNKVTFPRRADKNHSAGKSCIVVEALRLRKEENTTSATLQTMPIGTTVQILQLGKKQTIDGIAANWVQVQLADGTKGWCFGGYLVAQ